MEPEKTRRKAAVAATGAPRAPRKKAAAALPVAAKRAARSVKVGAGADDEPAPRPYHHGNLREDLVRCGKAQLSEVGLAELSLRRIASEVGVSQVAPKHHFGNKEGLLAAIAASGFRDLTEFRFARLRPTMSPEQRLRTLLSAYVAFATLHPTLFHLMFAPQFRSPETHAELNEAASQSYQMVARAAGDYLAAQGKADEAKAHDVARIAWMCMHGVATLIIENRINPFGAPKVSREQLTNQTLDLVFAGIRGLYDL
ncbi:TetR/AcrR family transcriptional regulator [Variovorax sp. J22R133]|uniref:TetR/AcrR family transcriptional regulator n=1 Tax=Variovorax brevis TaxID=3053503 RepID=UPI002574DC86|nr:TetR/AcrR family transcriptional regulator [Variovorax sp. J22R133]MDM0111400.1 TetR/AcrR family transcriptional regulator [Variovorax sp. J22R133]